MAEAEQLVTRVEAAFAASALPDAPSKEQSEHLLVRVRTAFYQLTVAPRASRKPGVPKLG